MTSTTQQADSSDHPTHARLCKGCELTISTEAIEAGKSAYCPRCGTKLYKGGLQPIIGNLALALTCLLLFIPSHFFPFISIRLVGVMIPATLPSGTFTLMQEGFVGLGILILFCSSIAPLSVCIAVIINHLSLSRRWFKPFRYSLMVTQKLKQWMMLDVFLVSLAISCFKLRDYSDIFVGPGLLGIILLQLFMLMLVTRISVRRYWEAWQSEESYQLTEIKEQCDQCNLSQPISNKCLRCRSKLTKRKPHSVQKTWALLVAAAAFIIPANIIPISILFTNGKRIEDTIFSGVAGLITKDMYGIALIIFVASIIVPVAKIIGMSYILLSIQLGQKSFKKQRMVIYFVVKWIGKWSVMDLFVISIMMTLVDRGQILNFTPGFGAVAFGVVVVLTMLATENFDPRLIWDQKNKDKSATSQ